MDFTPMQHSHGSNKIHNNQLNTINKISCHAMLWVMLNNDMVVFCNEQHVNLKAIYSISMNRASGKVFSVVFQTNSHTFLSLFFFFSTKTVNILSVFDEMNQNNCSIALLLSHDSCYICLLPYPMNRFIAFWSFVVLPWTVSHYKLKMSFHLKMCVKFISIESLVLYDNPYTFDLLPNITVRYLVL